MLKIALDSLWGMCYHAIMAQEELDKMLLIRLTDKERRSLKALTAMKGTSVQEFLRAYIQKEIAKWERK